MQDFAPNTHTYNCPLTQTCKHTVMHAHKTQPRPDQTMQMQRERRVSAMSVRSRIICCPNHWVRLDRCVCLHFAYLSLFHVTSLLRHPRIPFLPSPFIFAFCRAVIFSEASSNDKRVHQTQGRLVIISTRWQTYIIFTSPAYLPARLSVTGPKSHTVTVWVTGSPAASECWPILWENTSRPSVAHMWLHLVTKGALSKHHVHEFPALTLETHWEYCKPAKQKESLMIKALIWLMVTVLDLFQSKSAGVKMSGTSPL